MRFISPLFWRDSLRGALGFLTIIRIPAGSNIQASAYTFSLAGLLIGSGLAAVQYAAGEISPVIMVAYLALITGFLHLDGLADTFDGLFSHRDKDKMLAIMRDSRVGAMGAAALVFVFIAKYHAFSAHIPILAIIAIPALSRFSMIALMHLLPYARKEGLAKDFVRKMNPAVCIQLLPAEILLFPGVGLKAFIIMNIVFAVLIAAVYFWYKAKIGGITGDMLGAACEISETALFLSIILIV